MADLSDPAWRALIQALHGAGRKAALAITGGGSGAIGELLREPGGSRLLLEAQVPYDEGALGLYLGYAPAQASSAETAIAMARVARTRAIRLAPGESDPVGLGVTAALVSDRPRRGEHRYHIATATRDGVTHCSAVLAKGRRDRAGEEALVARAIVLALARICGVDAPSPAALLDADETVAETRITADDPIARLVGGGLDRVTVEPDGRLSLGAPTPSVLMPGSFNPVHAGHVTLARVAEEMRRRPLAFEISITNVDKPPLAPVTVRQRVTQFAWKAPVELTRAPTFLAKSRLFPGATFVIGADTAERLVAAKYYGDDEDRMRLALEEIGGLGASFLVAVRVDAQGRVRGLSDIAVPTRYAELFTAIPERTFRLDVSSSALRAAAGSA